MAICSFHLSGISNIPGAIHSARGMSGASESHHASTTDAERIAAGEAGFSCKVWQACCQAPNFFRRCRECLDRFGSKMAAARCLRGWYGGQVAHMLRDEGVCSHGAQPEFRNAWRSRPLIFVWFPLCSCLIWLAILLVLAPLCIFDWYLPFSRDYLTALLVQWICSVRFTFWCFIT